MAVGLRRAGPDRRVLVEGDVAGRAVGVGVVHLADKGHQPGSRLPVRMKRIAGSPLHDHRGAGRGAPPADLEARAVGGVVKGLVGDRHLA